MLSDKTSKTPKLRSKIRLKEHSLNRIYMLASKDYLFFFAFSLIARILLGNEYRRMKPSASAWLYTSSAPKVTKSKLNRLFGESFWMISMLPLYDLTTTLPLTSLAMLSADANKISRRRVNQRPSYTNWANSTAKCSRNTLVALSHTNCSIARKAL